MNITLPLSAFDDIALANLGSTLTLAAHAGVNVWAAQDTFAVEFQRRFRLSPLYSHEGELLNMIGPVTIMASRWTRGG